MFEVEKNIHMLGSGTDCEIFIMTGQNEYLELVGSVDDYDNMDFDWLGSINVRDTSLPPMFRIQ